MCLGGGFTIDKMYDKIVLDLHSKPNLILLHVGRNDLGGNVDPANAHNRLAALVDWMFDQFPQVTIIISTTLPNADPVTDTRAKFFNGKIPELVATRQQAGRKLTYVDFSSSWYSLADIGTDG